MKKKFSAARQFVDQQNDYLSGHPEAVSTLLFAGSNHKLAELGIDNDAKSCFIQQNTLSLAWRIASALNMNGRSVRSML